MDKYIVKIFCGLVIMTSIAYAQETGRVFEKVLLVEYDPGQTKAYQLYRHSMDEEFPEVHYLIDLFKESPYQLLRNGKIYNGEKAAAHLESKIRWFRKDFQTTEEFIENVASHSWLSGKIYYLILDDGRQIPLKVVLYNELKRLRETNSVK